MKRFSAVAFLGLVATVTLVRADSIGGMVSNMENTIRSEASGVENTLRRNMPRIRLPTDRPHMPNMPNVRMLDMPNMPSLPNIGMPNMPNFHIPSFEMPDIGLPSIPNMPNMPNMPSLPRMNIMSRLRSELQALESDLSNAMPNMPSAQGMINRVRGMIRSLVPGM